jgi:hypothetical protein
MLRFPPLKFLQLATVLSLAWPGGAVADDTQPQPKPVTMTCEKAQNQMLWGETKAGYPTDPKNVNWTTNQKGKQSCAKLQTGTDIKVVKKVTSSYKEWHVVDREKNCQAEADRHNKAINGFEQEHINDAAKVFNDTDPNAILRQVVKLEFCADNEEAAEKRVLPPSTRCPRTQERVIRRWPISVTRGQDMWTPSTASAPIIST